MLPAPLAINFAIKTMGKKNNQVALFSAQLSSTNMRNLFTRLATESMRKINRNQRARLCVRISCADSPASAESHQIYPNDYYRTRKNSSLPIAVTALSL